MLLPFSVFLYYGFVNTGPVELDESAVIDGSSGFDLFLKIVFPLLKPVTITVMVINFMGAWNNFIIPLYVMNRSTMWPMTLSIYNFYGRRISDWQPRVRRRSVDHRSRGRAVPGRAALSPA